MELPPELQQSLRASQEQSRFSLVFEGTNRRHVSSCVLIDNSYVIASIPGKFARHQGSQCTNSRRVCKNDLLLCKQVVLASLRFRN